MRKFIFTVALMLATTFILSAQSTAFSELKNRSSESTAQAKLRQAENAIERFYVDEVNADSITEVAIRAMLKALDPHSTYTTADETKALDEPLQGNFSGIGISFNIPNDTLIVIQTIVGGPAERVGMLAGDRIVMVDDTVIAGVKMKQKDVMKRIRGPKGSKVKITVLRDGREKPMEFVITRDDIPIYSVDASYMVDPATGYIRLTRFAEDTPREIAEAMTKLKKAGMQNLIIDLQDNGGGYLNAATDLAEMFLRRGDKILFTKSSRSNPRYYTAPGNGVMLDGRVVILVNQYSASASEILSGALQDNDRAVIVGRRTFGKGLVQRPIRFDDGSMIRLTIARYYTPSGRCIQKPYTSGDDKNYRDDISDRYNRGELQNADSIHFDESQLFFTAAGRKVYGGGGIMPDRFVPLDTTYFTPYYRDLLAKSVITNFAVSYYDTNRAQMQKKYKSEESFLNNFEVTDDMLKQLIKRGEEAGVKFNKEQFNDSKPYLAGIIKAIIGRDLFTQDTWYKVMNPLNPIFTTAMEILALPRADYNAMLRP